MLHTAGVEKDSYGNQRNRAKGGAEKPRRARKVRNTMDAVSEDRASPVSGEVCKSATARMSRLFDFSSVTLPTPGRRPTDSGNKNAIPLSLIRLPIVSLE